MALSGDEFLRLESLIYRPVSTRPDWLKAWRNEANYLLYLARRASDDDDIELVEELEEQAREMADMVEARWQREAGARRVWPWSSFGRKLRNTKSLTPWGNRLPR
jgi:hypothetical protein